MVQFFIKNINNEKLKQTYVLYGAMIFSVFLGFGTSIVNTRFMTVVDYGKLKFIQQLFTLISTILSFGFAYSAGRIATQTSSNDSQKLCGTIINIHGVITFFAIMLIYIFSFFADEVFNDNIAIYVRYGAPLIFSFIFSCASETILPGFNKIYTLAFCRIAPQLIYILLAGLLITYWQHINLYSAIILNFGITGIVSLWALSTLRPIFTNSYFSSIWQENKTNGFPVYIGSLANVATANLIGVVLAYYSDMKTVGYYSLALTTTMPIQFIPSVIGTTLFKSFAKHRTIPLKVIWGSLLPTIIVLFVFTITIDKILILAFSNTYLPVLPYARILSIGMAFHGIGDLLNRFLGAHGRGKELRNAALVCGLVNVFGCAIFLPGYGAIAAAEIRSVSSFAYFAMLIFYYKKIFLKSYE